MIHPFFNFFNKDRPYIDPDSSKWPKEWSTVYFKLYPRLPQIKLPKPKLGNFPLEKAILERESKRDFSHKAMTLEQLSTLLFYSAGITNKKRNIPRRAYPSGGARYPLEIYPIVFNIEKLKPGIYHYNVKNHQLELLTDNKEDIKRLKNAFKYPFVQKASVVFLFTIIPWRSSIKYGNFALKVGLIEAGHLAEHLYLIAQMLNLKCCALGGLDEDLIHKTLDIDGITEIAFYSIAAGK